MKHFFRKSLLPVFAFAVFVTLFLVLAKTSDSKITIPSSESTTLSVAVQRPPLPNLVVYANDTTFNHDGTTHYLRLPTCNVSPTPEFVDFYYSIDGGKTYTKTLPSLNTVGTITVLIFAVDNREEELQSFFPSSPISVKLTVNKVAVTSVKLTPLISKGSIIQINPTTASKNVYTLGATVSPSNASVKTVSYSVSNSSIASISAGKLTLKGTEGELKVTVTSTDNKYATQTLTYVVAKQVTAIRSMMTTYNTVVGKKLPLSVVFDNTATTTTKGIFSYKVSPASAAKDIKVPTSFILTVPKTLGGKKITKKTAITITIKALNGKSKLIKINIFPKAKAISSVKVTGTPTSLKVGQTKQLKIALSPGTATVTKAITASSSNSGVLSIDAGGKLVAKKKGTATITIKVDSKSYKSAKITVK